MSEVTVVQMSNPVGLEVPEIRSLLERAFASDKMLSVDDAMEWVEQAIQKPDYGVFLAREGSEWVGMMLIDKSSDGDAFSQTSWVPMIYSEGSREVRRAMSRAVREWMVENGLRSVRCINRTGASDKAHMRMFGKLFGDEVSAEVLGSVIEYSMKES